VYRLGDERSGGQAVVHPAWSSRHLVAVKVDHSTVAEKMAKAAISRSVWLDQQVGLARTPACHKSPAQ
jgi:hypothetical protein